MKKLQLLLSIALIVSTVTAGTVLLVHSSPASTGDFVSKGCTNYAFTATVPATDNQQQFMLLMSPPTNFVYTAHIHLHAISGSPMINVTAGSGVTLMQNIQLSPGSMMGDQDLNINQGAGAVLLGGGNSVILSISGTSVVWVFVDRCLN